MLKMLLGNWEEVARRRPGPGTRIPFRILSPSASPSLILLYFLLGCFSTSVVVSKFARSEDVRMMMGHYGIGGGGGSNGGGAGSLFPSETYIHCHFNPMCYCKYDQKTQIYDSISRLWQLVRFNSTEFHRNVGGALELMTADPNTIYWLSPGEVLTLANLVANSSTGSRQALFEPGPVFDLECSDVPIALIPTGNTFFHHFLDYNNNLSILVNFFHFQSLTCQNSTSITNLIFFHSLANIVKNCIFYSTPFKSKFNPF